ncbi:helix-turn-helix transcriptional regulator [Dactylosporangium sp. NPDC049140]|uniref:helix-turn-helix domain-containing protein n=1 Tax=Dactylosporangium sp. NPDC049140 TaxID=3155647 RepID=UPI0033FE1271
MQPAGAGARRVGHLIREARKRKHWSQDRLNDHIRRVAVLHAKPAASQESLKVMISRWENGKKIPDQYSRRLLSLALDVAPETLGLPLDPLDDW